MIVNGHKLNIPLFLFSCLYLIFAIFDFSSSVQTGYVSADRTSAHIYLLLVSIFLVLYFLNNSHKITVTPVFFLLILIALWTSLINIRNGVSRWTILVQENMAVMWIFSYFFFRTVCLKTSSDNSDFLFFSRFFYLFFLVFSIFCFFNMQLLLNHTSVVTMSYYVVGMVPWLLVYKPDKKILIFLITIIAALLSMKRGAIIAILSMALTYGLFDVKNKRITLKRYFQVIFLIICVFLAYLFINIETENYLSDRFSINSLMDGSGRAEQVSYALSSLNNHSLLELLCGVGCERFLKLTGLGIHNEWLGFLYNYGIIGFILFLSLTVSIIKLCRCIYQYDNCLGMAGIMMLVFFGVMSMFSSVYFGYNGLWVFGFFGFLDARKNLALAEGSLEAV